MGETIASGSVPAASAIMGSPYCCAMRLKYAAAITLLAAPCGQRNKTFVVISFLPGWLTRVNEQANNPCTENEQRFWHFSGFPQNDQGRQRDDGRRQITY